MQRPHSIDPQVFIEVMHLAGCRVGPSNPELVTLINPAEPGVRSIVRMKEDLRTRTIEAHLRNLRISEESFLKWFDHYVDRS
jgi:hypothetical protein